MTSEVEMFESDSDSPALISPELVLVSTPEVARAAREALEPRSPPTRPAPPAESEAEAPSVLPLVDEPAHASAPSLSPEPPRPAHRSRTRLLLPMAALALIAAGFFAGRELTDRGGSPIARRTRGALPQVAQTPTAPRAGRTEAKQRRRRLPLVTWKPKPGVRRYRFDLVSGHVAILTIVTDEPRVQIPLTWPNAGHRRHLTPGRYHWTVRAATPGLSQVIARGTLTLRKSDTS